MDRIRVGVLPGPVQAGRGVDHRNAELLADLGHQQRVQPVREDPRAQVREHGLVEADHRVRAVGRDGHVEATQNEGDPARVRLADELAVELRVAAQVDVHLEHLRIELARRVVAPLEPPDARGGFHLREEWRRTRRSLGHVADLHRGNLAQQVGKAVVAVVRDDQVGSERIDVGLQARQLIGKRPAGTPALITWTGFSQRARSRCAPRGSPARCDPPRAACRRTSSTRRARRCDSDRPSRPRSRGPGSRAN